MTTVALVSLKDRNTTFTGELVVETDKVWVLADASYKNRDPVAVTVGSRACDVNYPGGSVAPVVLAFRKSEFEVETEEEKKKAIEAMKAK